LPNGLLLALRSLGQRLEGRRLSFLRIHGYSLSRSQKINTI
jgi:hypothetical protein